MPANETRRSRTTVLVVTLVVLAAVLTWRMWPSASAGPAPSNQAREPRKPVATTAQGTPQLEVRLDELQHQPPTPGGQNRNPFRFYVPPPPPPPAPTPVPTVKQPLPGDPLYVAPAPPQPPPPPPIPIKFIGTVQKGGDKKYAIFSDGRGVPVYAAEGETVLGQW